LFDDEDDEVLLTPEEVENEMKLLREITDFSKLPKPDIFSETFGKDAAKLFKEYVNI
jgi:hypothetical protein